MIERINLLLKAKNITARQFAEEIGIQPSGMSHILSGRNNPSLDFVMKVVKRWPEVNINWLMFGKGEMFAGVPLSVEPEETVISNPSDNEEPMEFDLFSQPVERPAVLQKDSEPVREAVAEEAVVAGPIVEDQHSEESVPDKSVGKSVKTQVNENRLNDAAGTPGFVQPNVVNVVPAIPMKKKIAKIVVLYDDHSFSEYFPE